MPKSEVREVHLELLLSRPVVDKEGKTLGRIEEIHGEEQGSDIVITEYRLGPAAMMERLSAWVAGTKIMQLLGMKHAKDVIIPWDKLDLTDLYHPLFTGTHQDLKHQ